MSSIPWKDLKQAAGEAAFEPLPPSEYDVYVESAEPKKAQSGKDMITTKFKVESGPYTGRTLFNQFVISPENANALSFFFRHMRVLGLDDAFFATNPPIEKVASSLINKRCRARVSIRQYNGEDRNQVDSILPPADGRASASPQSQSNVYPLGGGNTSASGLSQFATSRSTPPDMPPF